jgi:hypothetical protein
MHLGWINQLEAKTRMFNWFLKQGCDPLGATYFINTFPLEDIRKACAYVQEQIIKKKNEIIPSLMGYLRKTLENKWWIPKKYGDKRIEPNA